MWITYGFWLLGTFGGLLFIRPLMERILSPRMLIPVLGLSTAINLIIGLPICYMVAK